MIIIIYKYTYLWKNDLLSTTFFFSSSLSNISKRVVSLEDKIYNK